jgi:GTP-binding protein
VDWTWDERAIRLVDTAGLRRKAKVQEKLEKLSTHDSIRAITFAEVVILVMDATHPFEIQDLQIADLVEREGRSLVFVLAKWDLVEDQQAKLPSSSRRPRGCCRRSGARRWWRLSAETGRGPGPADAGGDQGPHRLVDQGEDPRPQRLAEDGGRAPSAARRGRPPREAQVHGPDQGQAADLRAVRQPRRPAAGPLPALPCQLDPRELRPAGRADPADGEVEQEPVRRGRGEVRVGLEPRAAVGGQDRAGGQHASRRAAKAKAGAGAKPKLHGKDKPQGRKAKPGNPRGRAAKLARPGVKPKRASRPSSPKRPR